ncbi:MAG: hypothetical protein HN341_14970, partial [Verrucomicrobia bacterium]|nr:hypothetical protein [Verrucomicrobiota bacterium]
DIYATSIDYDPTQDLSIAFFKTVQNKMHTRHFMAIELQSATRSAMPSTVSSASCPRANRARQTRTMHHERKKRYTWMRQGAF